MINWSLYLACTQYSDIIMYGECSIDKYYKIKWHTTGLQWPSEVSRKASKLDTSVKMLDFTTKTSTPGKSK